MPEAPIPVPPIDQWPTDDYGRPVHPITGQTYCKKSPHVETPYGPVEAHPQDFPGDGGGHAHLVEPTNNFGHQNSF